MQTGKGENFFYKSQILEDLLREWEIVAIWRWTIKKIATILSEQFFTRFEQKIYT